MRVLILDNYDSFTYNLVQLIRDIPGLEPTVRRNRAIQVEEAALFDAIVLSPGPGLPSEAGIMPELISSLAGQVPLLGVCLGHQAIAEAYGATLRNMTRPRHGVSTPMTVLQPASPLFDGLPPTIEIGRYHSWVVEPGSMPECLRTTAMDDQGDIMALEHLEYPVFGVQFHPESILTPTGDQMIRNFFQTISGSLANRTNQTDHAQTLG